MAPFLIKSLRRLNVLLLFNILALSICLAQSGVSSGLPKPVVPFVIQAHYNAGFPVKEELSGYLGQRYYDNLEKRLLQIDEKEMLAGFLNRPGKQDWVGEHVGKYLETAANTWEVTKDKRLKTQMDRIAATLMSTQLPDGYLGTYLQAHYWTSWDVWVHKYDIYGLLAYYRITGKPEALSTCKKIGDLLCLTFGDGPGQRDIIFAGEHVGMAATSVLDPMAELYRWTGDKKYLDFCHYILSAYDHPKGPRIIKTLLEERQVNKVANGKAYEMLSNLVGIVKMYRLTGEKDLLKCAQIAFDDIVAKRLYISGSASDHEYFKPDFDLAAGNDANMGEGCVTTTWIQLNTQLFTVTGEMKYFNEIERSVYNHLLAAENPQSGCVSYYTPLMGIKPYSCEITCCLSSVPRGIAFIPWFNYVKIDNVPAVMFYESARITDTIHKGGKPIQLRLNIVSSFPEKGTCVIHVSSNSANKTFALQLRIPYWSTDFKATIGPKTYTGSPGEFLNINRKWGADDKINVAFNMPVKVISGGKSYPNTVAFQRGPQILSYDESINKAPLNGVKLPAGLSDLSINKNIQFPAGWLGSDAYTIANPSGGKDVVLVPYADAGQTGGRVATWLPDQ
jgi:DUF1680 family protein